MMVLFRRLIQIVIILAVLSFALFGLLSAMPGDPVDMLITSNPRIKPEDVVRLKKLRGLDQPWPVQYIRWIWGYNDPKRPPTVSEKITAPVAMLEGAQFIAKADVKEALADADFVHTEASFLEQVKKVDPAVATKLTAAMNDFDSSKDRISQMGEALYDLSPEAHKKSTQALSDLAVSNLTVTGLFGAKANKTEIEQSFASPGEHRIWFKIKDRDGLEAVGSVAVFLSPLLEPKVKEQDANDTTPEEDQLAAGGTETPEPEVIPPTRAEILEGAQAVSNFRIAKIDSKVVDQPEDFKVFLADAVQGISDADRKALTYKLLAGSPGSIDKEGVYTHLFEGPGQCAIEVEVSHPKHGSTKGAFSVEHGPIADDGKFNRGFLWVFAGDKEALGFSNTYKRPVWELLAGTQTICGDGLQGAGETCDDYNTVDGDGCSSECHDESLTALQKFDASAAGAVITSGRVVNTIQLMLPAILLSLLIAIPLGVLCAYRQYSWIDYLANFFAFIGISLPVFWFAIMVLAVVAEKFQLLPAGGIQTPSIDGGFWVVVLDRLKHSMMPALVLSIAYTGRWLRYMRGSMLEVLPLDFIRTARAKGLSEKVVILKHALRNALIPVVTVLALSIPALFGGALLTETVFAWPGIGRLQYDSVMNNDYYVAIVVFLISSALLMLGNLLADVMYVIVDPRIRKS